MTATTDPASAALPLRVSICYATAHSELWRDLLVEPGTTIGAAIAASGIGDAIAQLVAATAGQGGIASAAATPSNTAAPLDAGAAPAPAAPFDLAAHPVGIFGKKKAPDTVLRDGDRVEIYRPLLADPKESRRRRASGKSGAGKATPPG